MEFYLANPEAPNEHKGKRGKDFIYSLLHNLKQDDIRKYKAEFSKLFSNIENQEQLWFDLSASFNQNTSINEQPLSPLRTNFTLPTPIHSSNPEPLTPDEKDFVFAQMLQKKEPCSAGAYAYQAMSTSPLPSIIAPCSAGRQIIINPQIGYEGFSDFTGNATQQMQIGYPGNFPQPGFQHFPNSQIMPFVFYTPQQYQ